jgi:hypothetical protein
MENPLKLARFTKFPQKEIDVDILKIHLMTLLEGPEMFNYRCQLHKTGNHRLVDLCVTCFPHVALLILGNWKRFSIAFPNAFPNAFPSRIGCYKLYWCYVVLK